MNDGSRQDPTLRSPLTAQQEFLLKGQGNGTCIIFGSKATGIDYLEQFLVQTFGNEFIEQIPSNSDKKFFEERLKGLNKRTKEGTTLLVTVPWACDWDKNWVQAANNRLKSLLSKKTSVRIAFIADPRKTHELMKDGFATSAFANAENLTTIQLTPWHDRALRQWLEACNIPIDADQRQKISKVTCNWPIVLDEFRAEIKTDQYRWPESLNKLDEKLSNSNEKIYNLGVAMGLDRSMTLKVINSIGDMGETTTDELLVILDEMPSKLIESTLNYSQTMSLIQKGDAGGWILDPLVERVRHTIRQDFK